MFRAPPTRAFSSEVDTGSREENASRQESGAPFRSYRNGNSSSRADAGFTIIEVLVALALVAVSIVAIGSVMAVKTRGVRAMEQHVALMQTTRTLMMVGVPQRAELQSGTSTGQTEGYRWTIDVSPLGNGWTVPGANVPWTPELVRIRVRSPSGALSDIRTVRLMPRPPE
ncbi:prepilin-type N-terminal cleavage/methylation domain-containing protein [Bradyrhizobium sp. CCBAU 51753]|uniref:prepilin-type N-terminal cleavage/methylation domain-containing protein n=1 Tax=Bradyrhizobium sp. CCBAU 51753 TaxID=1325100 RepID=UPI001FEEDCED|nr:prepilin-type N-terminal cleavage/methylation domain-containing protein [Bradyrhizobium sp. CCBAU 51753]